MKKLYSVRVSKNTLRTISPEVPPLQATPVVGGERMEGHHPVGGKARASAGNRGASSSAKAEGGPAPVPKTQSFPQNDLSSPSPRRSVAPAPKAAAAAIPKTQSLLGGAQATQIVSQSDNSSGFGVPVVEKTVVLDSSSSGVESVLVESSPYIPVSRSPLAPASGMVSGGAAALSTGFGDHNDKSHFDGGSALGVGKILPGATAGSHDSPVVRGSSAGGVLPSLHSSPVMSPRPSRSPPSRRLSSAGSCDRAPAKTSCSQPGKRRRLPWSSNRAASTVEDAVELEKPKNAGGSSPGSVGRGAGAPGRRGGSVEEDSDPEEWFGALYESPKSKQKEASQRGTKISKRNKRRKLDDRGPQLADDQIMDDGDSLFGVGSSSSKQSPASPVRVDGAAGQASSSSPYHVNILRPTGGAPSSKADASAIFGGTPGLMGGTPISREGREERPSAAKPKSGGGILASIEKSLAENHRGQGSSAFVAGGGAAAQASAQASAASADRSKAVLKKPAFLYAVGGDGDANELASSNGGTSSSGPVGGSSRGEDFSLGGDNSSRGGGLGGNSGAQSTNKVALKITCPTCTKGQQVKHKWDDSCNAYWNHKLDLVEKPDTSSKKSRKQFLEICGKKCTFCRNGKPRYPTEAEKSKWDFSRYGITCEEDFPAAGELPAEQTRRRQRVIAKRKERQQAAEAASLANSGLGRSSVEDPGQELWTAGFHRKEMPRTHTRKRAPSFGGNIEGSQSDPSSVKEDILDPDEGIDEIIDDSEEQSSGAAADCKVDASPPSLWGTTGGPRRGRTALVSEDHSGDTEITVDYWKSFFLFDKDQGLDDIPEGDADDDLRIEDALTRVDFPRAQYPAGDYSRNRAFLGNLFSKEWWNQGTAFFSGVFILVCVDCTSLLTS